HKTRFRPACGRHRGRPRQGRHRLANLVAEAAGKVRCGKDIMSTPPTDALANEGPDEVTVLHNRFFELSRPIADAFHEPTLDMQVGDPARFFATVEALDRLGYNGVEQSLLVLLDEFAQLEQRSYDELYLWSITELSRRSGDHVEALWPMVLTLD